jgi:hypothetical protein
MTAEQARLQLAELEPIFHRHVPESGFAFMTTEDFWEIGASGRIYSREAVLSIASARREPGDPDQKEDIWQTSGFQCRKLSEEYFLLTYDLTQDYTRRSRRTTLWRLTPGGWQIAFHQGTLVQDE